MLRKFKFSNFRCYADEVVFDMTAMTLKEHNDTVIEKNGVGILPVAAIYGANASGKSSFFMAMLIMSSVIVDRYLAQNSGVDVKNRVFTTPFMFDKSIENAPTLFETTIIIDSYEYRYGFSCNKQAIFTEYLYKKKISKNTTVEKTIFYRDNKNISYGKISKKQQDELNYCFSMSTDKTLLLTDIGMRNKDEEIGNIFDWFLFNGLSLRISSDTFFTNNYCERLVGDMLYEYEKQLPDLYRKYKSFINEVDPSIDDMEFIEEKDPDGTEYHIARTVHIYNGKKYTVKLSAESEGTQKIMYVSLILFRALEMGGSLFIDELDSKMHPLILQRIIRMFTSKSTNLNGAQLIFSAHNLINFNSDDLRRDEIWLTEKKNHKSRMFLLASCEEGNVRSDLNFSKCYLSGRFGGVPFKDKT